MEIPFKPRKFTGANRWQSKCYGVVLVSKQEDIDPLWELLCKQDSYWEEYKYLIKVAPQEIESERDLENMCQYCGKTDMYRFDWLKEEIDFAVFQYREENYSNKQYIN